MKLLSGSAWEPAWLSGRSLPGGNGWLFAAVSSAAVLHEVRTGTTGWIGLGVLLPFVSSGIVLGQELVRYHSYYTKYSKLFDCVECVSVLACGFVMKNIPFSEVCLVWVYVQGLRGSPFYRRFALLVWVAVVVRFWVDDNDPWIGTIDTAFVTIVAVSLVTWMTRHLSTQRKLQEANEERDRLLFELRQTNAVLESYNRDLREAAFRNVETGLWNLRGFLWQANDILASCHRHGATVLLCALDIYDSGTSRALDAELRLQLQKEMAQALVDMLPHALVGHLGGERFGVLVPEVSTMPREMTHLLGTAADQFGVDFVLSAALFPLEGKSAAALLAVAEEGLRTQLGERREREENIVRRTDRLTVMGQLAAGIAHEIRNPLTVVRGFIQLSSASWRDLVLGELDRINRLVGDFLSLSRSSQARPEVADLRDAAMSACALMEPAAVLTGVTLTTELGTRPVPVYHDGEQIRQVLMNLIRNALEAMADHPNGISPEIQLTLQCEEQSACLRLIDNGPGIPAESLDDIFNPFFSTKDAGTGLGLSIASQLITAHGGELRAENQPDGGAQFTILLPLATEAWSTVTSMRQERLLDDA